MCMPHQPAANDAVITLGRCRTLAIPHTVSTVHGYPTKLKIFQTGASRYWQVRCFFAPSTVIRSLRTTNKTEAIERAKAFFQQQLLSNGKDQTEHAHSAPINHPVTEAVSLLLTNEEARMSRGEITRQCYLMTRSRARGEISRFFNKTPVGKVDRLRVDEFMARLSQQGVRASIIKAYLVVLRKVLTVALHQDWIERLPAFPKIKTQTNPRGHFTVREYLTLLRAAKRLRLDYQEPQDLVHTHRSTRGRIYTATPGVPWEFAWLIGFMVNSFVRPVDAKVIQHKHVEIVRGNAAT